MKKIIFEEKNVETIIFSDVTKEDVIFVKKSFGYFGAIVFDINGQKWICASKNGSKTFDREQLIDAMSWFGKNSTFFTV